jgi:hypothetical protein
LVIKLWGLLCLIIPLHGSKPVASRRNRILSRPNLCNFLARSRTERGLQKRVLNWQEQKHCKWLIRLAQFKVEGTYFARRRSFLYKRIRHRLICGWIWYEALNLDLIIADPAWDNNNNLLQSRAESLFASRYYRGLKGIEDGWCNSRCEVLMLRIEEGTPIYKMRGVSRIRSPLREYEAECRVRGLGSCGGSISATTTSLSRGLDFEYRGPQDCISYHCVLEP